MVETVIGVSMRVARTIKRVYILFGIALFSYACGSEIGEAASTEFPTPAESVLTTTPLRIPDPTRTLTRTVSPTPIPTDLPNATQTTEPGIFTSDWVVSGYDAGNTHWNRMENVLYPPLERKWTQAFPYRGNRYFDGILIADGRVLVTTSQGMKKHILYAFSEERGSLSWTFPLTGGGGGSMCNDAAAVDGMVYFSGQHDKNIYAMDIKKNYIKWTLPLHGRMECGLSPLVEGNNVILGLTNWPPKRESEWRSGTVISLNLQSREVNWSRDIVTGISSMIIESKVVVVGSSSNILGLDINSGAILWQSPGFPFSDLASYNGKVIENGFCERSIRAHTYDHGTLLWEHKFPDRTCVTMAIIENYLYLGEYNYNDLGDRWTEERDQFRTNVEYPSVYVLDISTGEVISQRKGFSNIYSIVGANGVVYISSAHDGIYALDKNSLETLWKKDIDYDSNLAIANGILYEVDMWLINAYGPIVK